MDKNKIRKELILKRKAIEKQQKILYDSEISRLIIGTDYWECAENVLLFASTPYEFNTEYLESACRKADKRVFYPRCADKSGNMDFFQINSRNDLSAGLFGIPEPKDYCPPYVQKENDIVIVPALSVDSRFYRIGYGKGYYDRFLRKFNGVSICPCYEEMLTDILPADKFDIKIDVLVTDKEVIL